MCYSAQAEESFKKLRRLYGASPNWAAIKELFWRRLKEKIYIPKAMELDFENPESAEEQEIKTLIDEYRVTQVHKLEQDLFKQRKRLADAERTLKTKTTKKALEDQRIATDKVESLVQRIAGVKRTELKERDGRIFPMRYSFIVIDEGRGREIVPARYHCRLPGKPAFMDRKMPGLYNARRDNLEKFWKELFGKQHGLMRIYTFWENVSRHNYERRELKPGEEESNVVVHFDPKPARPMNIACLWSRIQSPDEPNDITFAGITDEPTAEIKAAGHDRSLVMLQEQDIGAWLNPAGMDAKGFYRMFDERVRPFFEHRLAA